MEVHARWAFQLSLTESPKKLPVATWSRGWSRCFMPTPTATPGSDGQLLGRLGQRQLECPTGVYLHPPSEYPLAAPAEESSSLTTAGSRACRGCSKDQPRSPQSTVRLLPVSYTHLR